MKCADLSNKFTPIDMDRSLSRVRSVRVDEKWMTVEVMKKHRQSFEADDLDITP